MNHILPVNYLEEPHAPGRFKILCQGKRARYFRTYRGARAAFLRLRKQTKTRGSR